MTSYYNQAAVNNSGRGYSNSNYRQDDVHGGSSQGQGQGISGSQVNEDGSQGKDYNQLLNYLSQFDQQSQSQFTDQLDINNQSYYQQQPIHHQQIQHQHQHIQYDIPSYGSTSFSKQPSTTTTTPYNNNNINNNFNNLDNQTVQRMIEIAQAQPSLSLPITTPPTAVNNTTTKPPRSHKVGDGKKARAAREALALLNREREREDEDSTATTPDLLSAKRRKCSAAELNFEYETTQLPRSAVEIIANAGISPPDATLAKPKKTSVKKEKKEKPAKKVSEKKKPSEKGHNAVERRYRNNINNHIATLRDIVPALRHLKPLPSMPASRRRASQFSLPTSIQAPTPAGLIDGIPAAKTLSKGTILGKSVEYIQFLQVARGDLIEDLDMFEQVVRESSPPGVGARLIKIFEERQNFRETERESIRQEERVLQDRMDAEDGMEEEDEEEDENEGEFNQTRRPAAPVSTSSKRSSNTAAYHSDNLYEDELPGQYTYHLSSHGSSTGGYSPASSDDASPRHFDFQQYQHQFSQQQQEQHPQQQPRSHFAPRILLASFMGLSFVGGAGYDFNYNKMADVASDFEATAWTAASGVASRSLNSPRPIISPASLKHVVTHPSLLNGLIFLGLATLLSAAILIFNPVFFAAFINGPSPAAAKVVNESSQLRQRRRATAIASIGRLSAVKSRESTHAKLGLQARRELLKLVGAPSLTLLPALIKEGLVAAIKHYAGIEVGGFGSASEGDRTEVAAAWVRIAEIESTVGLKLSYLARCYTFARLYNLSNSRSWPTKTPSTALTPVTAILAIHLLSLDHPRMAHALWTQATVVHRKKSDDVVLAPWVDLALSTDFDRVAVILAPGSVPADGSSPSDTLPLLQISEARCKGAAREVWVKIFIAVINTTCPPHQPLAAMDQFTTIVDMDSLLEQVEYLLQATPHGTIVNAVGMITKSLCLFYTGKFEEAIKIAKGLKEDGLIAGGLACAQAFFNLLLNDPISELPDSPCDVDILASVTLGWLAVRRASGIANQSKQGGGKGIKSDSQLHATALSIRRLLGMSVFRSAELSTGELALGLENSQDMCVEALTTITRGAAGVAAGHESSDSGIEIEF